jgi:hypothetical protein
VLVNGGVTISNKVNLQLISIVKIRYQVLGLKFSDAFHSWSFLKAMRHCFD